MTYIVKTICNRILAFKHKVKALLHIVKYRLKIFLAEFDGFLYGFFNVMVNPGKISKKYSGEFLKAWWRGYLR